MANLEGKLSSTNSAVVYTKANGYFSALNSKLSEASIEQLTIKTAYTSKYEIIDELRSLLKSEFKTQPPPGVEIEGDFEQLTPLLDTSKAITEIATTQDDYTKLENYINSCAESAKGAFDPTIAEPFTTNNLTVYPIPNNTNLDIRRYARVFYFETPFNPSQKAWLTNNAPLYGFVMYEDYALYYIGFAEIKGLVMSKGVEEVVNRFQRTPIPADQINITVSAVQAAADPIQPTIDKTPNGTMYFSNPSNPLLVVFGGIDVEGKPSGEYMPAYFDGIYDRYNIWIADSSRVNGSASYEEVLTYIREKGINPPTKTLYCFSGGYNPGSKLISNGKISDFQKVLLVDIWMKNDDRWPTWVKSNANKTSYFYTSFGSNGSSGAPAPQQDSIIASLGYPTPKSADSTHYVTGGDAHMKTNTLAVVTL